MGIELLVSQAVHNARLLERALHDSGPWTIAYGAVEVPAVRLIADDRIIFRAHFPDACLVNPPVYATFVLRCRDEDVAVRTEDDHPEDGEFIFEWTLRLRTENVPVG